MEGIMLVNVEAGEILAQSGSNLAAIKEMEELKSSSTDVQIVHTHTLRQRISDWFFSSLVNMGIEETAADADANICAKAEIVKIKRGEATPEEIREWCELLD